MSQLVANAKLGQAQDQIIRAILSTDSVNHLLEECCKVFCHNTGATFVRAWMLNAATGCLELVSNTGYFTNTHGPLGVIPMGQWLVGRVAVSGISQYHMGEASSRHQGEESESSVPLDRFACVPIVCGEQCLGVFSFGGYCPDAWGHQFSIVLSHS